MFMFMAMDTNRVVLYCIDGHNHFGVIGILKTRKSLCDYIECEPIILRNIVVHCQK